jgi:hypothetical protein
MRYGILAYSGLFPQPKRATVFASLRRLSRWKDQADRRRRRSTSAQHDKAINAQLPGSGTATMSVTLRAVMPSRYQDED